METNPLFDLTGKVVFLIVVFALIYDLYVYRKSDGKATISTWVRVMSKEWPMIPFLLGVLAGHFFWYL